MVRSTTLRHRSLSVLIALCAIVALAPAGALAGTPANAGLLSGGTRWSTLPGSVLPGLQRYRRLSRLAGRQQIDIAVSLRSRDTTGLDQFLSEVYNPASPSYHHFLTTQQFAQRFGPDPASPAQIVQWLQGQGLQVTGTSANGLQISARGKVSTLESAFDTPIDTFQQGSRTFFANTQPMRLPSTVAPDVLSVSGLSTAAQQQPTIAPRAQANASRGYTPSDIRHLYDLDPLTARGINGSGQSIAIVSYADYSESDVSTFDQQFGLSNSVTRISVSSGRSTGAGLGSKNGQDEAELDIEMTQGAAPGANILMYEGPNSSQGALAVYNRIVSDNRAAVITTSWGDNEDSYSQSEIQSVDQVMQEAAAQGQSFFAASGDSGAFDAASHGGNQLAVDYPASDPWVTGVGGTTLDSNGSQYVDETAWSDTSNPKNPGGSGGGLSDTFQRPSWQAGPGVNNQYSNGMRQVPDVAANADVTTGYQIYTVNPRNVPQWTVIGGTSASSPLWAGFAATVNQALGRRVGFLNPALYELGQRASSFARAPFHDVTSGDNLHYPATPGWDFATGWGSFDGDAFVADLQGLPASSPTTTSPAPTVTRPTATPAAPTVTSVPTGAQPTINITKVLLLHTVQGKLQKTSMLKVGEKGTLVVLYKSTGAGSRQTGGTVLVRQNGTVVQTLTLKPASYQGKAALTATVQFTSKKRVGTILARVTVHIGVITSALNYVFTIARSA